MDEETRGFIEKMIDKVLNEAVILPSISWLQEKMPIKSLEDLALGYFVGVFNRVANDVLIMRREEVTEEDTAEIRGMLERRIPEIRQKISTELGR